MIGYLDAGTGSMVAGAIAAGAAGVGVVAKSAWMKVSPRRKKKASDEGTSAEADTTAPEDAVDPAEA
jgi:hypothetical protein